MTIIEGQQLEGYDDRPLFPWQRGRDFTDLEFHQCRFQSCAISVTADPKRRSRAQNIRVRECVAHSVSIYSLIAEEVLVDGLKTVDLLQTWGAVFKHVKIQGQIGRIMLSISVPPSRAATQVRALTTANHDYYANVDWALDISEASFHEADLRGVPGNLIRRDPVTQVLVRREQARAGHWKALDLSKTHWQHSLEMLATSDMPSSVLVAPKRARNFNRLLDGLKLLRDAGVAEPD